MSLFRIWRRLAEAREPADFSAHPGSFIFHIHEEARKEACIAKDLAISKIDYQCETVWRRKRYERLRDLRPANYDHSRVSDVQ